MKAKGPDYSRERARLSGGARFVAGIDEVGRGPLAGPVGVAAVILDPLNLPEGLDDSKALSAARREALNAMIFETALAISLAYAPAGEIDLYNIRGATLRAMTRAAAGLAIAPDFALVDGRDVPPGLACPAEAVVKGDALCVSIAAASIVAKVARDSLMSRVDVFFPGFGFARHAGYPTKSHREALGRLGPSPIHRNSFRVKPT